MNYTKSWGYYNLETWRKSHAHVESELKGEDWLAAGRSLS